jgi:hypothetical protein
MAKWPYLYEKMQSIAGYIAFVLPIFGGGGLCEKELKLCCVLSISVYSLSPNYQRDQFGNFLKR